MNTSAEKHEHPQLTNVILWVMTIATGLVVANLYYNQPLLGQISVTFHIGEDKAQLVSMLTQMGYATGMLLIVPMADMKRRKKLMMVDFIFIVMALLLAAFSPTINILMAASFLIGASSTIPQMLVPMTAHLARPHERGKKVGVVMSGLLIGILLSRTVSGFIGFHFGWRGMFLIAAGLMLVIWLLLFLMLPEIEPQYEGNYGALMRSLLTLIKEEPKLRLAAVRGALCFACFGAFWTTLTFLLKQPQFGGSSQMAGMFGLVGVFGALGASVMGRVSDKMNPHHVITLAISLVVLSFIIFGLSSHSLVGLVIGVILLDMGVQSTHISNQIMIFALRPEARNRLNTVYMVSYFLGGAFGTYIASLLWNDYQWTGVCIMGGSFSALALLIHVFSHSIVHDQETVMTVE
ncbi:MFS transporter permease [Mucilaginibacter sp. PPCGB 2223]|uniref:MFS transporter n=1 Tax=Mucilaginibacter sp. PPCGB 2223 TaxID=1886027 RepID=UPI0008247671|nr:MFS transporter [Mucilaginibacter sp. PPCGB 2223]OCX54657.1 MFS transporter permease [Mucilaginibacter sp. PPCGB 2223]